MALSAWSWYNHHKFRHSNRYLPKNSQSKPVRSRYGSFSKNYQESQNRNQRKTKASSAFEIQETQKKVLLIILEAK
jgi:hypothetical protein